MSESAVGLDSLLLARQYSVLSYLVQAVKVVLHALDGNILAILDALGFQHLTESALTLLGHKPVLCLQQKLHNTLRKAFYSRLLAAGGLTEAKSHQPTSHEGMCAYCSCLQTLH